MTIRDGNMLPFWADSDSYDEYAKQPFDCMTFVRSSVGIEMSCAYLGPKHAFHSYYQFRPSDIAAAGTNLNFFSYNAVWAENPITSNTERMHYVLYATEFYINTPPSPFLPLTILGASDGKAYLEP